jgi:hypothetical protein
MVMHCCVWLCEVRCKLHECLCAGDGFHTLDLVTGHLNKTEEMFQYIKVRSHPANGHMRARTHVDVRTGRATTRRQ